MPHLLFVSTSCGSRYTPSDHFSLTSLQPGPHDQSLLTGHPIHPSTVRLHVVVGVVFYDCTSDCRTLLLRPSSRLPITPGLKATLLTTTSRSCRIGRFPPLLPHQPLFSPLLTVHKAPGLSALSPLSGMLSPPPQNFPWLPLSHHSGLSSNVIPLGMPSTATMDKHSLSLFSVKFFFLTKHIIF